MIDPDQLGLDDKQAVPIWCASVLLTTLAFVIGAVLWSILLVHTITWVVQ